MVSFPGLKLVPQSLPTRRERVATTLHLENGGTPEVRGQSEDNSNLLETFIVGLVLFRLNIKPSYFSGI